MEVVVGEGVSAGVGESVGVGVWDGGRGVGVLVGIAVGVEVNTIWVALGLNRVGEAGEIVAGVDEVILEQPATINPMSMQHEMSCLFISPT
jgi:hypothetical protein